MRNWDNVVNFFFTAKRELAGNVKGDVDKNGVRSGGLHLKNNIDSILKKATEKGTSYIALRDAEALLNQVEEVRFEAQILSYELKTLIDDPAPIKEDIGSEHIRIVKALKVCKGEVDELYKMVQGKYAHVQEIIWGVINVNSSVKRMYGDVNTYSYSSVDV